MASPFAHRSHRVFASVALIALIAFAAGATSASAQTPYFPAPGAGWEHRKPEQVGLNAKSVDSAVAIAMATEAPSSHNLAEAQRVTFGREPFGEATGPFAGREGAAGLIIRKGYIIAEWGNPDLVETTHSVTKSFVTTTVGLAYDRRMIRDIKDPVRGYMAPIISMEGAKSVVLEPFASEHNRKITWEHLLRQTSDWQGTLWGKPDWADRFPRNTTDTAAVINRARHEPGTVYTYNDVRVNLMALASLNVWRRPLPQVLKELVMDPIGASNSWRWTGYDNAWVVMDGQLVQSVAGGGHWGGGMMINARDMARFGYLTLHNGKWGTKQLISEEWIKLSRSPGPANNAYGFANYFLNTGRKAMPNAPETAFYHLGNGNNIVYVDQANDLVIVARWMNSLRSLDAMVKVLTAKP